MHASNDTAKQRRKKKIQINTGNSAQGQAGHEVGLSSSSDDQSAHARAAVHEVSWLAHSRV